MEKKLWALNKTRRPEMRYIVSIILLVFGFTFFHLSNALADEHGKGEIQLLKDSAAALQATNPTLADKLNQYATREAGEKEEEKYEEKEAAEKADVQMLKDAASALKASRSDLADGLNQYADKEAEEEEKEERK